LAAEIAFNRRFPVERCAAFQKKDSLATDGHGYTRIRKFAFIRVHLCPSVAKNGISLNARGLQLAALGAAAGIRPALQNIQETSPVSCATFSSPTMID
jgi:hypothetical protein